MKSEHDPLRVIELWRDKVDHYIDDIGGWRDSPAEKVYKEPWPDGLDKDFAYQTSTLIASLMRELPNPDTSTLQLILRYASHWYTDHNAERIPCQPELEAIREQAFAIVYPLGKKLLERAIALEKKSAANKQKTAKKVKRRNQPPRTVMTTDEREAWLAHERGESFRGMAKGSSTSHETFRQRYLRAEKIISRNPKSTDLSKTVEITPDYSSDKLPAQRTKHQRQRKSS